MGGWINDLINGLVTTVVNALTSATQAALNWVLGILSSLAFTSPNVTKLPQVIYVSGNAQLVATACMALIVMVVGFLAMSHGSVQDRYSLKELLPRVVIGFAAANLATPIVSAVITGANALTGAITGDRYTSTDSFTQIRRVVVDSVSDPVTALVSLVLRELALFMLMVLVVTWLARVGVLLVLAGAAPVALMCHALPQLEPVARIWWRSLFACLAVQLLQALTLHMAVATLLSSDANLPGLGLPTDGTGLLNMLIACYLLWLVIRIPKWVARSVGGGSARGVSMLSSIVRLVVVQQVLGAVGLRGGRRFGRGRTAAAAGARAPATHLHANQHQHLHQHLHLHQAGAGRPPGRPTPGGPGSPPAGARAARPHGGRVPAGALPAGAGASTGSASPPRPGVTPPGAIPPRGPRWQAAGVQPSGTGWPVPAAGSRPSVGRASGTGWPGAAPTRGPGARAGTGWPASPGRPVPGVAQPSGTGWPAGPPQSKSYGSGVRRGR